jgi:pyridoxal phosphate enzyme (YggS family)
MTGMSPTGLPSVALRIEAVRVRLAQACQAAGRAPEAVRLLAVSKTFGADAVLQAVQAGQTAFGENYIQEGVDKVLALGAAGHPELEWHCIGPIQSNKTRLVAEHFDWVHTVDRLKVAQRLSDQRPAHVPPLQVCVQVNVDGGANKSGVAPEALLALAHEVTRLPRLQLRGLMCIPEPAPSFQAQCAVFAQAKALLNAMQEQGLKVDTLSMGMSDDLEAAVASGSTMVRVGSAIFGSRSKPVL